MALLSFLKRDPLKTELGSAVAGRVDRLTFELGEVVKQMTAVIEVAQVAKRLETRVLTLERSLKNAEGIHSDFEARVMSTLESLRQSIYGARGGRPRNEDREAAELGRRVLEAMQNPAQLQQFVMDLQRMASQNGAYGNPNSPV